MLAEMNWVVAVPTGAFGAIFCVCMTLALCLCGCRKKEPKDDLAGVEGRVKITNPDDYQQEVNANRISAMGTAEKIQKSVKRSLPDLPVDSQVVGSGDNAWEPNGDATSELYATVMLLDEKTKKLRKSKSESDSASPLATYSKVNEGHPYDKLSSVEHPYAQLKVIDTDQRTTNSSQSNVQNIRRVVEDNGNEDGSDLPMHSHSFKSGEIYSVTCADADACDIAAATAISGQIIANDDLPYMTPPAHFSGDSQDSGKGYTSISVREPLAAIRRESHLTHNKHSDYHYATVSDDSDDMYAAIDDPCQVYTSGSDTYARINNESSKRKSAPQPPSVDSLRQMTITSQSHSRQASTSSLTASTVINSPKPEKRPANSPLPPTPTRTPDSGEIACQASDSALKPSVSFKNVEDMYAKVNKKLRRETDCFQRGGSVESGVNESSDSSSFKLPASVTESSHSCHSHFSKSTLTDASSTSSPSSSSSSSSSPSSRGLVPTNSFTSDSNPRSGYETFHGNSTESDRKSDPGYETVHRGPSSESDPEYEKLKPKNVSDGYAKLESENIESDRYSEVETSECDGYAKVNFFPENINGDDGYAKVGKNELLRSDPLIIQEEKEGRSRLGQVEPTYESLTGDAEAESLGDPNYESVRFAGGAPATNFEPPYQLLRDCETGRPVKS